MKRLIWLGFVAVMLMTSCNTSQRNKLPMLRVMSFNIRNSGAWEQDGDNDWNHRRKAVAFMLLAEHPDALGMQEMLPDQLAYLDSILANKYDRIGVGRDDGMNEGENMCIYYRRDRLELLDWQTKWLSETPDSVSFGWDAACRRTVTIAHFRDRVSSDDFVYMNTHLDHMGKEARRNSVLLLAAWADEYDCPVLLGGDMNSDLTDSIFLPLQDHDLLSARKESIASDTALTYNGYGKDRASRIDHFFVKDWKVLSFRTMKGNYGVPYISDHYPVMVEIAL